MLTLALDSSSRAASCALLEEDRLLGETYLDCGLTHSQTLLPAASALCSAAGVGKRQIGRVAVSAGPGSFTGLRIGLSTAKAVAAGLGVPCCGVSTLLALAYNMRGARGPVLAALDARRGEVYYALFDMRGEEPPRRLCADAAAPAASLIPLLDELEGTILLCGDGDAAVREGVAGSRAAARLAQAPPHLRYQRASGVGYAALDCGDWADAASLCPRYLRLSQAERERLEREHEEKKGKGKA